MKHQDDYLCRSNLIEMVYLPGNTFYFTQGHAVAYYLLGCFMSDGNVTKSRNSYRVKFDSKDLDWLTEIRNLIFPDAKIHKRRIQDLHTFQKRSPLVGQWLVDRGCTPNKSLILRWPKLLPEEFIRDFIRGMIDGDGSIVVNNSVGYIWGYVELCSGSELFIDDFIAECARFGFEFKKTSYWKEASKYHATGATVFYARLSNSGCKPFLKWIYYEPGLLTLRRKFLVAEEIKRIYLKTKTKKEWASLKNEAINLSQEGNSKAIIADKLGLSIPYLKKNLKYIQPRPSSTKISKLKDARMEEAITLYNEGRNVTEIMEQTKSSRSAICNYIKAHRNLPTIQQKVNKIVELRQQGMTRDQIREITTYSNGFIDKYIIGMPYKSDKRTMITPELLERLHACFASEMKNAEIVKKCNVSLSSVKKKKKIYLEGFNDI